MCPIISSGCTTRLRLNHTSICVDHRCVLVLIADRNSASKSRVTGSKNRTCDVAIVQRGSDITSHTTQETTTIEIGIDGAVGQCAGNITCVGGSKLGRIVVATVNKFTIPVTSRIIDYLKIIVGCIALILIAVLSWGIISIDGATPIGNGNSRTIGIGILHIVGAAIACTEELVKGSACCTGLDGLARYHIAELWTATVFAHDTVVDDHINTAFHYLICIASSLGHDATAIELANERVIDAPGDITPYTLLIGCGNSAKSTTIDIAVRVVFKGFDFLIVTTCEIETGKVSAKNIDSTMTCLVCSSTIDMGTWCE